MAAHKFVLVLVGMLALLAVRTEAACEFYRNNEFSQSTSQWPCSHRPIGANKLLNHVPAAKAKASHILMKDEDTLNAVKAEIDAGASFADKAKEHSTCPSGKSGGSLGEFGPGQMVPEFDAVIWTADLDKVTDCVKTQFGYHLIIVTKRSE